jgi:dimethylargininase
MAGIALTREVPASFDRALAAARQPIDVALARRQHARYRAALDELGLDVLVLAAADDLPDCCFIEDTAIVVDGLVIVTRPGAPSRQGETAAVAARIGGSIELAHLEAPATLDGGDCLRVGASLYIGRSARTNAAGIARVAELVGPRGICVVGVELPPAILHLKCVCAPLGGDRITLADASIPRDVFRGLDIVAIPAEEAYAANVLAHGGGALVAEGFPRTRDALAAAGLRTIALDTSEFRKADGALTCLSILLT